MSKSNERYIIEEKGYRPTDKLDTSKPPRGGSAVPPIPAPPPFVISLKPENNSQNNKK